MPTPQPPDSDAEIDRAIEQEIRQGRKFTLADAISQEGSDFLKGESPIPKLVQVKNAIKQFVGLHLQDSSGALQATLLTVIQADDVICSRHFETPLQALAEMLQPLLSHDVHLREFVRQVDMRWGHMYDERPHFERPGHPPHPDDEYTIASVRSQLQALMAAVQQHSS
ncbi:hypothetical protein [Leptolyngbya iicbica]|uniref:Uncharacterized protein n=2 Tax=Cyanophyceae TaxID=3028117 RepID=A0A4Q7E5F5_9CYAN|nr:hypothetical protein [Leptolyngbya sp. LK]RZM77289.1 hypothetical protein DYY88_16740 [Leptolyngbya sp. LK]